MAEEKSLPASEPDFGMSSWRDLCQKVRSAVVRERQVAKRQPPPDWMPLEEVEERISKLFWGPPGECLYRNLLLQALRRIHGIPWKGRPSGQVPYDEKVFIAEDAINTAIEKLLEGKRRWNRDKSDYENLLGIVLGVIGNMGEIADNRVNGPIGEKIDVPSNNPSPENEAMSRIKIDELLQFLRSKDRQAAWMAKFMLVEGLDESSELAEAMDLNRNEIYAIRKRLGRLLKAYKAHEQ